MSAVQELSPAEKLAKEVKQKEPKESKSGKDTPDRVKQYECSVRLYREKLGLSRKQVAEATQVPSYVIMSCEQGYSPSLASAITLAKFFGESVEDLWKITNLVNRKRKAKTDNGVEKPVRSVNDEDNS